MGKPIDRVLDKNLRNLRSAKFRTVYDTIRQVSILLTEDLWLYEPDQNGFKRRLFDENRHYIDNASGTDHLCLLALRQFLYVATTYLPPVVWANYDQTLIIVLLTNPNTNRYYRHSLGLQTRKVG